MNILYYSFCDSGKRAFETEARIDNRIIGFILQLILKIKVIAQLPHGFGECTPFICTHFVTTAMFKTDDRLDNRGIGIIL